MGNEWFESVREAHRRAEKRLPRSVYLALVAGAEEGHTLRDNIDAFSEIELAPHIVDLDLEYDMTTTVMGQELSMPIMISPTGVQAIHPEGELAVARAAAERGTAMGLSSFGSKPVEDVAAANEQTFFQSYWIGTREDMLARAERARNAGAKGLIVTLDWSFSEGRDWGSPEIPNDMNLKTILKHSPEVLLAGKFTYLSRYARTLRPPELTVPNMTASPDEPAPKFFEAYGQWMQSPQPTWEDLTWLREQWGGPFMIKGITRVDDARRAVDTGASAISVSNHGGNNLDGTPASIRVLPAVVDAVGDQVEVVMDGGIRRGSDVLKAIALGAKSVMIGRAYLWGMAANGQAGVENVLDILSGGLKSGLMSLRRSSPSDLTRENLVIPHGFGRSLGTEEGSHVGVSSLHEAGN
ncbi:MAG TPA: mycofactocin biosynthesis FMN-dependent deaminase MftD [Candidatus Dietzia intestinigallinarum]|nr:mycofactocin biosynthesis FMN-dependent deaminase MftD [Candidatus Dietzia intestinigallinarum]